MNLARWQKLYRKLEVNSPEGECDSLLAAWSEKHRAYHTLQHLGECLTHLDEHSISLNDRDAAAIELALWYHDAVYKTRASDNERRSADWAVKTLKECGADEELQVLVESLIMATCHGFKPEGHLPQFIVDIDLAILGAGEERFNEYEQQVRQEYRWVPGLLYRRKRSELLQHFLDMPQIYNTPEFSPLEEQARRNLKSSILRLKG